MRNVDGLIASLNAIQIGELESVESQLAEVQAALERDDLVELVTKLDECLTALSRGDVKNFRRIKESIVSRLGHLR